MAGQWKHSIPLPGSLGFFCLPGPPGALCLLGPPGVPAWQQKCSIQQHSNLYAPRLAALHLPQAFTILQSCSSQHPTEQQPLSCLAVLAIIARTGASSNQDAGLLQLCRLLQAVESQAVRWALTFMNSLQAQMIVADAESTLAITGNGDIIESQDGIMGELQPSSVPSSAVLCCSACT